ncbi:MAG TPA: hypothetical protein VG053_00060 [Solirubrobacteraceae bacterium]|nr:hypothetical protein [Solirubrobacteraceae bacterium]
MGKVVIDAPRRAFCARLPRRTASAVRRRGRDTTLIAVVLLCLVPAGAARGDGDPASDVLLIQNAFYPYQPPPPAELEAALNALLSQARSAGMPLKVAIIGSREDLGAVPTYFGHPQQYAAFLDREISYSTKTPQPLLVVMPAGFGLAAAAPASALARVSIDAGARTSGLTRAAILAVSALARANGHAIAPPQIAGPTTTRRGGTPSAILFGLPVLLLILAGIPILAHRKRRASSQT